MAEYFVTTSWDGGTPENLRIAELLRKYRLKGTFYIPLTSAEHKVMRCEEMRQLAKDFEVGSYTIHGYSLTKIPFEEAWEEIRDGKKRLEKIVGKKITSFAYPNGVYTQDLVQCVAMNDFTYARSLSFFETKVSQILSDGVTLQAQDQNFIANVLEQARKGSTPTMNMSWDHYAKKYLEQAKTQGGVFHLAGNAQVIEENNDWDRLEAFLSYLDKHTALSSRITNNKLPGRVSKKMFSVSSHKSIDTYAKEYDKNKRKDEIIVAEIAKTFTKSAKVLDVESGTGRFAPYFAPQRYTGIESCKELCTYSKAKHWDYSFEHTSLDKYLKIRKKKFDLILLWNVSHSSLSPYSLVEKVIDKKLLTKDGMVVLALPKVHGLFAKIARLYTTDISYDVLNHSHFTFEFLDRYGPSEALKKRKVTQTIIETKETLVLLFEQS